MAGFVESVPNNSSLTTSIEGHLSKDDGVKKWKEYNDVGAGSNNYASRSKQWI
jgi:hypothetical protein